jgi:hypothetical protein
MSTLKIFKAVFYIMRHDERIEIMKEGYKALYERLESKQMAHLPKNVDRKKLEKTYDRIDNQYEWVLRKKTVQ